MSLFQTGHAPGTHTQVATRDKGIARFVFETDDTGFLVTHSCGGDSCLDVVVRRIAVHTNGTHSGRSR